MKHKTQLLADRFTGTLSQWPGVECVSLNEAAFQDTLDPYFAFILDVFYAGAIPGADERQRLYGQDVSAFETSGTETKDRFLIGDIPFRVEFKATAQVADLAAIADTAPERLCQIKDSGTYAYYRLMNGKVLFNRSGWIADIRKRLASPAAAFWGGMRYAHESKMEHALNDLGAALFQSDDYYYLVSSAYFIKYACLCLFCVNQRFEPSHRAYYEQVLALPVLPDSFAAQIELFLSSGDEISREKKYALAQLMAKGIVAL